MMKNYPVPNRNGFTLIELLVVISIIALLIGILLPALASSRTVAREVKCNTQVRQFMLAQVSYTNDYDGYLSPAQYEDSTGGQSHWYENADFMGRIPGVTTENTVITSDNFRQASDPQGFLVCPLDDAVESRFSFSEANGQWDALVSYGMNQGLGLTSTWSGYANAVEFVRIDNITRTSEMMAMCDYADSPRVSWPIAGTPWILSYNDWWGNNVAGPQNNLKYADWHGGDASNDPNATTGIINAGFVDGHVENLTFDLNEPYYALDTGSDFWMGGLPTLPDGVTPTYASGRTPKP